MASHVVPAVCVRRSHHARPGTAAKGSRVYAWRGCANTLFVVPISTISPSSFWAALGWTSASPLLLAMLLQVRGLEKLCTGYFG